ncbi:zinc protease [Dysgonomonas sp. PH5-45]|uniref:M16 family metallopeptidase n=1 Tax=unclassified Dysgonomonas TaxID=2630389 RepID=UPI0024761E34|nr:MULTISPECIES: pitrilysin family protein [unclassified Dysgonomonas]MDH6354114.1 zinc protease [Dysgonomonas sp. PH5-45]MDH6387035.1 zinc protease [Dysgonomonas sp. PH5-37]
MKKIFVTLGLFFFAATALAQHIEFEEYDLDNGLHVILQQDKSAPVVTAAVMYHVGAKDERPDRTGFAHFFEHLLFEGTENIGRGEWFKMVSSNGGQNNANTSDDRTYYYETFPSNNLQLALWMEAERMYHPVINQIGVDTQNEVVKEEKRLRVDNTPYGRLLEAIKKNIYSKHPYRWTTIGEMEHLDAATLDEFKDFFKKFYVPNNAVLVVSGDFDKAQAKKWIHDYYNSVPRGADVVKTKYVEEPITQERKVTFEDPNIQLPMYLSAYRTTSQKDRDAYVLDMISIILSDGKTSRLYQNMVDKNKTAIEATSFSFSQEDYGIYVLLALPTPGHTAEDIRKGFDEQIARLQTELISEDEYTKLQNKMENHFISQNASTEKVAENLATYYMLFGNVNLINDALGIYKSITREEIRDVAKKYLNTNQRVAIDYIPATSK